MNGIVVLVLIFIVFGFVLAVIAFLAYRRVLRRAKGVERGLKMVPLLIHLPPPSDDTEDGGNRDVRDIMREKISQAQVLYDLIAGTAQAGFKSKFYGQRHISFEIIASNGLVHYFAAVPVTMVSIVEQAIVTAYPGAHMEEVEDHNIFNPQGHLTGTAGGELVLKHTFAYPIAVLEQMERDPMIGLLNALSKMQLGEGAAIQIMLRPAYPGWTKKANKVVEGVRHTRQGGLGFGLTDIAKGAVKTSEEWREDAKTFEPSKLEEQMMQGIEEKTKHPGYEVLIRVLTSSPTYDRSQILLRNLVTSFALFEAPGSNGFQFVEGRDMQGLVTAFIFRFFPPELTSTILNSVELATLFHLPDAQFTPTLQVERQMSKQVDGPVNMPQSGLLMGYNFFRGVKKEIRLSPQDRRRHTYIVGQTGTGKSTILENLAVQDMLAGNGFAFIDPHGDTAEKLISMVPKERAEDVVYFNPGDMEHPLGLNLFEFTSPEQKDFLVQESINMLYKLYDPQKTGIIGPRFEHWFRNAALTLMADPNGASFVEIPKVFTDTAYLKNKFKYLNDPTVIEFWTKEMAQTSDYHKSEMLGWFVSKFGAFLSNELMRNIIGQTTSAFNIRDIMDNKKILIVNLGKGRVGEQNSQLLGMIFVIKFQAAAMSRSDMPEDQRNDFCLYVDEFQNFSTDSFANILSEARKYRLNLIVANQFIGQLSDEIRDAVFGNVGTMLSFRTGPEDAEFLVKQFEPIFDERDMVNLPNYNAMMKLLIGGVPSHPFSVTMLPPLGQAHAEMGLAIKQLSAAKFGVPRATVEADIFARLQGTPKMALPPVPPPSAIPPQPTPASAISPTASVPVPAASAPAAPAPAALPIPATAPTAPAGDMLPPARPAALPPAPSAAGASAGAVSPPAPPSTPSAPSAPDAFSMTQLKASSPTPPPAPAPPPTLPPAPTPVAPPPVPAASTSLPAPVTVPVPTPAAPLPPLPANAPPAPAVPSSAPAPPPAPVAPDPAPAPAQPAIPVTSPPAAAAKPVAPAPVKETSKTRGSAAPVLRIEAHEADGRTDQPTKPPKLPNLPKPLLIEAHEADGKVNGMTSTPTSKPAVEEKLSPKPEVPSVSASVQPDVVKKEVVATATPPVSVAPMQPTPTSTPAPAAPRPVPISSPPPSLPSEPPKAVEKAKPMEVAPVVTKPKEPAPATSPKPVSEPPAVPITEEEQPNKPPSAEKTMIATHLTTSGGRVLNRPHPHHPAQPEKAESSTVLKETPNPESIVTASPEDTKPVAPVPRTEPAVASVPQPDNKPVAAGQVATAYASAALPKEKPLDSLHHMILQPLDDLTKPVISENDIAKAINEPGTIIMPPQASVAADMIVAEPTASSSPPEPPDVTPPESPKEADVPKKEVKELKLEPTSTPSIEPKPAAASTPAPVPPLPEAKAEAKPPEPEKQPDKPKEPPKPQLQPGEVYIAEDGSVIQG